MKNRDIIKAQNYLETVSHLPGVEFAYEILRVAPIVTKYVESLKQETTDSKGYTAYLKEFNELNTKFTKKDEKGEVVREMKDGRMEVQFNVGYVTELKRLKMKHKKALKERDDQIKKFHKLLDKEVSIKFKPIRKASVSKEISAAELAGISCIIEQ